MRTAFAPLRFRATGCAFALCALGSAATAQEVGSIVPDPADRSGRVVILGAGFGEGVDSFVLIDDLPAIATTWLPGEIHAYVPEAAALGPVEVRVVTPEGASDPVPLTVTSRQPEGRILWRFQTDGALTNQQFVTVGPDGTIYTADRLATYAITPDGALKWVSTNSFGADGNGGRPISIGPDGTLYSGMDIVDDAYAAVVALNPEDGSVKWRFIAPNTDNIDAGPSVGPDGKVYGIQEVGEGEGLGAFALDPNGNLVWSNPGDPVLDYIFSYTTNSEIKFGADRLHVGVDLVGSNALALWTFSLAGAPLWTSHEIEQPLVTFPVMDPFNRVITIWGLIGLHSLTPDGQEDWFAVHPDGVVVQRPAVDSLGNSYTGNATSVRLWSLDADGGTRWVLPSDFPNGVFRLGVTPDDRVIVADGTGGIDSPQWVRGYGAADGSLLWQVALLKEKGLEQVVSSREPGFSADSRVAYVAAQFVGQGTGYGYVYAIRVQDGCYADFTGDGALDLFDFLGYVNLFNAGDPAADCDGDGDFTLFDFLCFTNAFNAGC
jgi:hypothetical protein